MATRASTSTSRSSKSAAGKPSGKKRFLIFREEGADKFWFATLEGARWTAEWGRRGYKGQSKMYTFETPKQAQADFEAKVQEKLGKGYENAPQGAKAAEVVRKTGYRFKLANKGEDQFGGMPPGVSEEDWPRCKDCDQPMQFLFLLNAHPERLPLKKSAALAVFMCGGEVSGGGCPTYDPNDGANAVLLLSKKALALPAIEQPPAGEQGQSEELLPKRFLYREVPELEPEEEDEENMDGMADKVGGYPGWLQDAEVPKCRKCRKPMHFVAQLHDQGKLNFGDSGEAYLFVCPQEHEGRFLWQCC
jgi:predicted DNA-binding WGR domain protein